MQTKLAGLYMQSTGTQVIRLSQLAELPIPIPALEIQNKLAQFFLATEKRNQIAQEEIIARQQVAEAVLINVVGAKA
jgi:restriction endonuclease S subunit